MVVLRFTQALLKEMKAAPIENELTASLFSWHANMVWVNRRKHILLINDLSRLSVIFNGVRSAQLNSLTDKFRTELRDYLVSEGIEPKLIESYMKDSQQINIARTNNRSVLGTMKEVTFFNDHAQGEHASKEEHMKWLNRIIHKPIDYEKPIDVFIKAIEKHYL